jgi:hypothetical protein
MQPALYLPRVLAIHGGLASGLLGSGMDVKLVKGSYMPFAVTTKGRFSVHRGPGTLHGIL